MKRQNVIALSLAAVAVAALSVWALQPRPVIVQAATVERGAFEQTVSEDGKTRVRERYVVSAPLAGHLERITLQEGDPVKPGETLAVLMPSAPAFLDERTVRELQARVGAAEAQLARASAETQKALGQSAQARADLDRQAKLSKDGFVSPAAREQAELAMGTAERTLEASRFAQHAAEHEREQARAALTLYKSGQPAARWNVPSPLAGSVLKVVQKSEGPVALGAPLLELADPRSLEAIVDVLSQEAVAIRPGMAARLELGSGLPPLAARVRLVEPAAFTKISALGVEEQRVNVVLDFAEPLDKVQTIGDAFRVDATIVVRRVENAVKVPVGALFREGDRWALFAIDGERARKRTVKLGGRNSAEALVEDGLKPGERVVVYPADSLRDGSRIKTQP